MSLLAFEIEQFKGITEKFSDENRLQTLKLQKLNIMTSFAELPQDLPIPIDDGACDRLLNQALPSIFLQQFKRI